MDSMTTSELKCHRHRTKVCCITNKKRDTKPTKVTVGASVRVCKFFHIGKGETNNFWYCSRLVTVLSFSVMGRDGTQHAF